MTAALRGDIRAALTAAADGAWRPRAAAILRAMGYASPKTLEADGGPEDFARWLGADAARLSRIGEWRSLDLVFQLTGDELPALARADAPTTPVGVQRGAIDSFLFLAADLGTGAWTRTELVAITRVLNRATAMPAVMLFRHGARATVAVIDRRDSRAPGRAGAQVVTDRVSLVKDIDLQSPHRAHLEIMSALSIAALAPKATDFRALYDLWLDALSASELNKRFYDELSRWFAWSVNHKGVAFPAGQGDGAGARETALIRLLTRLMFVWFIKEKGLVPAALFDRDALAKLMARPPAAHPEDGGFHLAVLQNLFFATLNAEWGARAWAAPGDGPHALRHRAQFADPDAAFALFDRVPFLNGGLFECLDRPGIGIDGFTDDPAGQPRLPNALFFGGSPHEDLTDWFGKKKIGPVPGLIDLFERFKFTVEENTPTEEEAALDPELLGKVFENLLASYNEDTATTARNKSGSFYTPREVVEFMVDEALVAWAAPLLAERGGGIRPAAPTFDLGAASGELSLEAAPPARATASGGVEARLRALLDTRSLAHDLSEGEAERLIAAIENCRAIDPAVGSGAFPLGLLQKLVHVLGLLDPGGEKWRARNRAYYAGEVERARAIPAPVERDAALAGAEARLAAFDAAFAHGHYADYTRKLFLIERVLHGVDVQPIAVQIAKLRCFISLAVAQRVDDAAHNRGVTPLPNLETKFVAANTLTPLAGREAGLVSGVVLALREQLRDASRAFFSAAGGAAKRAARERITSLRHAIAEELRRDGALASAEADRLAAWDPFDANAFAPFFDAGWMFNLEARADEGLFDLVLANPPYVRQEKIEGFRVNGAPVVAKPQLKRDYAAYAGTADLFVYFYERGVRLLKPGGALAFVTSNKWYRAGYGKPLRDWLVRHARILKLVDFGDAPVFDAIAYPTILVATRRAAPAKPEAHELIDAWNWACPKGEDEREAVKSFPQRFAEAAFALPQASLAAAGWQFEPATGRDLLARLRARGTPLGEWCGGRFYYGIKTGFNDAFVIDGAKRAELIAADPASAEIIKPFLRGRDVKRWRVEPADKWLIRIESSENKRHPWSGLKDEQAERKFAETFPAVHEWWTAAGYRQKLINRSDQGHYFWELRSCAYWNEFGEPKIIIPAIEQRVAYASDYARFYSNDKTSIAVTDRAPYLLAIVNSSTSWWITRQKFASKQGGFYEFKPMYVGALPVPLATAEQEALITTAVDALLAGAERPRLEALLDAFVYELFFPEDLAAAGLSPFAAARDAGLLTLAPLTGPTLAQAANAWATQMSDPAHPLHAPLTGLQAIDAVRIIEGSDR